VLRQRRESDQQPEEIRDDHPLLAQVCGEAVQSWTLVESRDHQLPGRDRGEPGERDRERPVMEECDAEQRRREQQEFDSYAGDLGWDPGGARGVRAARGAEREERTQRRKQGRDPRCADLGERVAASHCRAHRYVSSSTEWSR
jgi:hypothetical protein